MKRNPKPRQQAAAFVPAPEPLYTFDDVYTVAGTQVQIKRMEWMATIRTWVYYLDKKIFRVISVITEAEMTGLQAKASVAA